MISGIAMFSTRASRYAEIPGFRSRWRLLVLAAINMAIFHLVSARGIAGWDTAAPTTTAAKLAGACSLLFWIGIMLSGRWVGHVL